MANLSEFLKDKLLRVFTAFFDLNDDGIIEWKDFEICTERIRGLHCWDVDGDEHNSAKETMKEIWDGLKKYADENKDDKISKEEWCNMWRDNVKYIKEGELADWHKKYMDFLFRISDVDEDDIIARDEYVTTYMSYGLSRENCNKAFDTFSLHDSIQVDKSYFRALWIEYFSSDDPNANGNHIFGMIEPEAQGAEATN